MPRPVLNWRRVRTSSMPSSSAAWASTSTTCGCDSIAMARPWRPLSASTRRWPAASVARAAACRTPPRRRPAGCSDGRCAPTRGPARAKSPVHGRRAAGDGCGCRFGDDAGVALARHVCRLRRSSQPRRLPRGGLSVAGSGVSSACSKRGMGPVSSSRLLPHSRHSWAVRWHSAISVGGVQRQRLAHVEQGRHHARQADSGATQISPMWSASCRSCRTTGFPAAAGSSTTRAPPSASTAST
jgi:hypothetical protein